MKKILWIALILLMAINGVGYGAAESAPSEEASVLPTSARILGTWQAVEDDPEGISQLFFLPDGTMTAIAGGNTMPPMPFIARGEMLVALMGEEIMAIRVSLKDDISLVFDGDEYTRTAVNAGALSLDNALLGLWASEDTEGLTYEFKRDGTYQSRMNDEDVNKGEYLATETVLLYSESDIIFHKYDYRSNIDGTLQFEEDGEKVLEFRRISAPEPLPIQTLANRLMGSWHSDTDGADMTFTYRPDGVMEVSTAGDAPGEFAYCVRGEYQASVLYGEVIVSETGVSGDVMSMGDFAFHRVAPDEGELCLENELIGIWYNDEGIGEMEFGSDGTTRCQGIESSYAIPEPGKLLLLFDQGFANLNDYSIDSDGALTLTVEGNTVTFEKKTP